MNGPQKIQVPEHAKPCQRCTSLPEACLTDGKYDVWHLCGDRLNLVCGYESLGEAVEAWNKMQMGDE